MEAYKSNKLKPTSQFSSFNSSSISAPLKKIQVNLNASSEMLSIISNPIPNRVSINPSQKANLIGYKSLVSSNSLKLINPKSKLSTMLNLPQPELLKFPTTPTEIISKIQNLPKWLIDEIQRFKEILYISKLEKNLSFDYSDEKGDYKIIIGDDIKYRYEIVEAIGKGTFGQVVKVFDHSIKKFFAMKIIKNRQKFFDQSRIEIDILRYLKEIDPGKNNNIVRIEDSFVFRGHMVRNI